MAPRQGPLACLPRPLHRPVTRSTHAHTSAHWGCLCGCRGGGKKWSAGPRFFFCAPPPTRRARAIFQSKRNDAEATTLTRRQHCPVGKSRGRYGGTKLERARELFEQATAKVPSDCAAELFLKYARLEEEHGLVRHAMAVYDRATKVRPPPPNSPGLPLSWPATARACHGSGLPCLALPGPSAASSLVLRCQKSTSQPFGSCRAVDEWIIDREGAVHVRLVQHLGAELARFHACNCDAVCPRTRRLAQRWKPPLFLSLLRSWARLQSLSRRAPGTNHPA